MNKPLGVEFLQKCVGKAHAVQEAEQKKRKTYAEKNEDKAIDPTTENIDEAVSKAQALIEKEIERSSNEGKTRTTFAFVHKEVDGDGRVVYFFAPKDKEQQDHFLFPEYLQKRVYEELIHWCLSSKLHIYKQYPCEEFEVSWSHHDDPEEIEVKG